VLVTTRRKILVKSLISLERTDRIGRRRDGM
jgi:hypothetical protein